MPLTEDGYAIYEDEASPWKGYKRQNKFALGYVDGTKGYLGDFVWSDENYNGLQDVGEPGVGQRAVDGGLRVKMETWYYAPVESKLVYKQQLDENGQPAFEKNVFGNYIVDSVTGQKIPIMAWEMEDSTDYAWQLYPGEQAARGLHRRRRHGGHLPVPRRAHLRHRPARHPQGGRRLQDQALGRLPPAHRPGRPERPGRGRRHHPARRLPGGRQRQRGPRHRRGLRPHVQGRGHHGHPPGQRRRGRRGGRQRLLPPGEPRRPGQRLQALRRQLRRNEVREGDGRRRRDLRQGGQVPRPAGRIWRHGRRAGAAHRRHELQGPDRPHLLPEREGQPAGARFLRGRLHRHSHHRPDHLEPERLHHHARVRRRSGSEHRPEPDVHLHHHLPQRDRHHPDGVLQRPLSGGRRRQLHCPPAPSRPRASPTPPATTA